MISSDVIRGYSDIMILFTLLEKDSYGYAISKEIEEVSKFNHKMKETTLYSSFNRLEKNGYIVSYSGEQSFGKRRTYFKITNSGRDYYKEKCDEWILTKLVINEFTGGNKDE